jgi:hypothetical protein
MVPKFKRSYQDDRTDKRTERTTEVLYTPIFFGGGIKILSKIYFNNKIKKSAYLVKLPFFPLIPWFPNLKEATKSKGQTPAE